MSAANEAAAGLTSVMVSDLVETIPVSGEDLLAADVRAVEAAETPSSPQQTTEPPVAATVETPEPQFPSFEPQLTDELQSFLDEPDFDDEVEEEVAASFDEDPDSYQDPAVAKKLLALEKRNKWLEEQNVRNSKKKWVAENLNAYPLLANYAKDEVEAIQATSRRGFAREAARLNDRFAKIAKPLLSDLEKAKEGLRAEVVQEARTEVQAAWGAPTTGPGVASVQASAAATDLDAARKTGQLHKVIGEMFKRDGVNRGGE